MSADWQISAGFLAELARPALYAASALASAGVLADSRRHFRPRAVALWTAFTLFLPHVTLPLYLVARIYARTPSTSPAAAPADANDADDETDDLSPAMTTDTGDGREATNSPPGVPVGATDAVSDEAAHSPAAASPSGRFARRLALPLVYAAALLGAGALYFYADYRSADAHLARARQAKLDGRDDRALLEYRAALRREDDPHVRKLLGLELSKAGRWEEALVELRAAERGGATDDLLAFHVAAALSAVNRPAEAADEYRKFLQTHTCAQTPPDWRCEAARATLRTIRSGS